MEIIDKKKNEILTVLLGLDIILLVIAFFHTSMLYTIAVILVNMLLAGTLLVLNKYGMVFEAMTVTSKVAKGLNEMLTKV